MLIIDLSHRKTKLRLFFHSPFSAAEVIELHGSDQISLGSKRVVIALPEGGIETDRIIVQGGLNRALRSRIEFQL
ncbi:MAG: hypothetical protein CUN53_21550, partial [Phototrophicales bacterium]